MSLPIVCVPPVLNTLFKPYKVLFSKPQFNHFRRLITGLVVSDNKTIQEINDSFGQRDQSNMNRFVSHSDWGLDDMNKVRLEQVKRHLSLRKKGVIIVDETLLHKTGREMELAGIHRSGITKRLEWGHMVVNAYYTDSDDNDFPITTDVYVRKKDCRKYGVTEFKTKREIALEEIDFAIQCGLPVGLVIGDAGYQSEVLVRKLIERRLDYIVGIRTTTKISVSRKKRISIAEYLNTIADDDFELFLTEETGYFYHMKTVSVRGVGTVKLVISCKYGDEENVKCYATNLDENNETIINLLIKRWRIECFHRDAKQHLGLEAYQVRKGRGMQVVALATFVAYTLVILAARILKTPLRPLRTIGEVCRYLALIAYKGVRWIRDLLCKPIELAKMLNRLVFVKNAKV